MNYIVTALFACVVGIIIGKSAMQQPIVKVIDKRDPIKAIIQVSTREGVNPISDSVPVLIKPNMIIEFTIGGGKVRIDSN